MAFLYSVSITIHSVKSYILKDNPSDSSTDNNMYLMRESCECTHHY